MTLAPFSAPKPFRLLKNLPGGAWGVLETYRRLPRLLQPPLHTQSLADLQPNAIFIQNALTPLSPSAVIKIIVPRQSVNGYKLPVKRVGTDSTPVERVLTLFMGKVVCNRSILHC